MLPLPVLKACSRDGKDQHEGRGSEAPCSCWKGRKHILHMEMLRMESHPAARKLCVGPAAAMLFHDSCLVLLFNPSSGVLLRKNLSG